jgi:hypothetical protein
MNEDEARWKRTELALSFPCLQRGCVEFAIFEKQTRSDRESEGIVKRMAQFVANRCQPQGYQGPTPFSSFRVSLERHK